MDGENFSGLYDPLACPAPKQDSAPRVQSGLTAVGALLYRELMKFREQGIEPTCSPEALQFCRDSFLRSMQWDLDESEFQSLQSLM